MKGNKNLFDFKFYGGFPPFGLHRSFARLWLDKEFWDHGHIGEGSEDLPVSLHQWDA